MPFLDKSTLTYPATNTFPGRRWLDVRDPLSTDFRSFQISDIWINDVALRAWIMVDRTGSSGTWIQMGSAGTGILTETGNVGGAVGPDGANNINILGSGSVTVTGNPGTNTLTISQNGSVATTYQTDAGNATPSVNILKILGAGGTNTSGAGNTVTVTSGPTVPTTFTTDAGVATPALNNLNVLGTTGITTSGAGSTVTLHIDNSKVGETITGDVGGPLSPTAGNWNIIGGSGCTTSGAGSTLTINVSGFTFTEVLVVGPTSMAVNNGYIANIASPSQVGLLLPMTAALGDRIKIIGKGTGAFQIQQNAGQTIHWISNSTTAGGGGSLTSTEQYGTLEITCITANTDWAVSDAMGNFIGV